MEDWRFRSLEVTEKESDNAKDNSPSKIEGVAGGRGSMTGVRIIPPRPFGALPLSPGGEFIGSPSKRAGVAGGRGSMKVHPKMMHEKNNPALKSTRRNLRNNGTPAEGALWRILKGRQVGGLRFRRQFSVGAHVLDFYCPSIRMAIELDGDYHCHCAMPERDWARDKELEQRCGIRTLRFENKVVFENPNGIVSQILKIAGESTPSPLRGTPPM